MKESIKDKLERSIKDIESIIEIIIENQLENKQEVLDYLDKLNKLSVTW